MFRRRIHEPVRTQKDSVLAHPMPVIVGSPRSGTTMLRLMLDAHSQLAIPPETGFLAVADQLSGSGEALRVKFFRTLVNYSEPLRSWPDFEIREEAFWSALTEIRPFSISEGYRTFYRLYAARFGKPHWGDKTPIYCRYLNTIRRVLPEARFIHLIRDGRDAALSLRRMWFSPGWNMEIQGTYWRDSVLAARQAGVGCDDYTEVRYEELVLKPQETLQNVCTRVGLTFETNMLSYYKQAAERLREHKGRSLPDGTDFLTQKQRVDQQRRTLHPPDPSCIFAWKQTMSLADKKSFESVAGDLLKELGYEV